MDVQVRNGQLDKEATELRTENSMLSESVNMTSMAAANAEQVPNILLARKSKSCPEKEFVHE